LIFDLLKWIFISFQYMKWNNIVWIVSIFILLCLIFQQIHYLSINDYWRFAQQEKERVEGFSNGPIQESSDTSHTVDMPLTNPNSCQNFCGPNARCAKTGHQCFADIDCPGCQPTSPHSKPTTTDVPGDNDAGKLTVGVTPQYSSLTSGYGTQKRIVTNQLYGKPSQANFGTNLWRKLADEGQSLFDKRYKPTQQANEYMPKYPPMYSATGEFLGDGPLPSNY